MTEIYHVTPITPVPRLQALEGRNFLVSHYEPKQAKYMPDVAGHVIYDCGAFSYFTEMLRIRKKIAAGRATPRDIKRLAWLEEPRDWTAYYRWLELQAMLWSGNALAIVPDVISEGSQAQDALLDQWPFGELGIPVWHTGEPIRRLLALLDQWPKVAIGSTDDHWQVGSAIWLERMDEVWREILARHSNPDIHMLRGVAVAGFYPFTSADSSSVGQNGHRYASPLFDAIEDPFRGTIAYADRLERDAIGASRLLAA